MRSPLAPTAWLVAAALWAGSTRAAAQVPSFDAADDAPRAAARRVALTVDAEGPARVVSGAGTVHCDAPCTVRVEPGFVDVRVGQLSRELFVDGPSRVRISAGVPALRTLGLGMLVAGAAVLVAAVGVPVLVCRTSTVTDATGIRRSGNPCSDIDDGVKVAWIAGAGVGLSAAIVGGIFFGTAGPRLRLDADARSAGVSFQAPF